MLRPEAAVGILLPGLAARAAPLRGGGAGHGRGDVLSALVSKRQMVKLIKTLGITGLSKSQVSLLSRDRHGQAAAFRTRPLKTVRTRSSRPTR